MTKRWLAALAVLLIPTAVAAPAAAEPGDPPSAFEQVLRHSADRAESAPLPPHTETVDTAPSALASIRVGAWVDPRDVTNKARDIRRASVRYDRTNGRITASINFQGPPTAGNTAAVMGVGVRTDTGCRATTMIVGPTTGGAGEWAALNSAGEVTASGASSASRRRNVVTVTASARQLRGRAGGCAFALATSSNGATVFDRTGYLRLGELPNGVLRFEHTPTPQFNGIAVGKWATLRFTVRNTGGGGVWAATARVRPSKGVNVAKRTIDLGAIPSRGQRRLAVKVRLNRHASRPVRITLDGINARARSHSIELNPLGAPVSIGRRLAGKYFWGFETHHDYAWDNRGLWFVDNRFAYVGFPGRGKPTCTRVTARCKRYVFNANTGKVRIGNTTGTINGGGITWKGRNYMRLTVPAKGTRWNLDLIHQGFDGCQPLQPCYTHTETISLRKNGRFRATHSGIYTWGASAENVDPQATAVKEGSGTYTIGKRGYLLLRYSSGKVVRKTIAVQTRRGRANPWNEGILVGDANYYL